MANEQEKLIKDAQYRKGLSIAFFNATNAAIEMVKMEQAMGLFKPVPLLEVKVKPPKKPKKSSKKPTKGSATVKLPQGQTVEERIAYWRDLLIKWHAEYYVKVIAPVGVHFKPETAIAALRATKSKAELLNVWNLLSEDERHHDDILKVAREERVKYGDE